MNGDDYKVGLLFSRASLTAASETAQANATHLAIAEVNDSGGINGRRVTAIDGDPGADPNDYRDSALQLCDHHQVQVLFGTHMSSTRKVVLPVVESRRRLLFYPTLYEGFEYSPYCFYTGSAPNQNSLQLARYVLQTYGGRVLFVGGSYVYPYESNRIMRELFEQAGGEIVDEIYLPFHATAEDFERVMQRVRETAPDAIYSTIVGSDIPSLHRAYRQAGFDPARLPIVSLATNEVDVQAMTDEEAEGHISAAPWFSTLQTPASQGFAQGLRVLVIHPQDAEARIVLDQLQRIGCIVEQRWPVPTTLPEAVDVVLLAVELSQRSNTQTLVESLSEQAPPIIAVVGYENPSMLQLVLETQPAAVIERPLRPFGLLTQLLMARAAWRARIDMLAELRKLQSRQPAVAKISMAKALLMARHRLGENDAHRRLQREAMTRRTSMEAIAQQIIDADRPAEPEQP
jgi:branched-chain amino acid transport system substrate-binding protein